MAFPISKKKKYNLAPKAGELPQGSKGIIVSYSVGSYRKDAIREILNILALQNSEQTKGQDLEQEIKKAKYEIPRFVPMSELTRGMTFIEFKYKEDLPNPIVKNIFENAAKYSCRFISKIIPIQIICSSKISVLSETLKDFVAKEFPHSKVSENENKMCDHKSTWALMYNRTHSNEADKKVVLDLLDEFIGSSYKVSLEKPDKMIVFQVVKSSCGFGCVENYSSTCKLNLHKLCQKPVNFN